MTIATELRTLTDNYFAELDTKKQAKLSAYVAKRIIPKARKKAKKGYGSYTVEKTPGFYKRDVIAELRRKGLNADLDKWNRVVVKW